MLTAAEARMKAAQLVLGLVTGAGDGWQEFVPAEDWAAIAGELRKIEEWLRREAVGGDKILLRQLSKETGRQVRPTAAQARALGRIVKGRRQ